MVFNQLKDVLDWPQIERADLLRLLKSQADEISIHDIMQASLFLMEDSKFVQENYRREYLKSYTSAFIVRIKEVKEHSSTENKILDVGDVKEAVEILLKQENELKQLEVFDPVFFRIYMIISLYTTFVIEEPIHPVGTPFPGGFIVKLQGRDYLCPVKERQKDNPGAVCGFCIAEQDPETI